MSTNYEQLIQNYDSNQLLQDLTSILTELYDNYLNNQLSIDELANLVNSILNKIGLYLTDINLAQIFSLDDTLQLLPKLTVKSEYTIYLTLKKFLADANFSQEDAWLILTDNIYWMSLLDDDIVRLEELASSSRNTIDSRALDAAKSFKSPARVSLFPADQLIEFDPNSKRFYKSDGYEINTVLQLQLSAIADSGSDYTLYLITDMLANNVVLTARPVGVINY